jgi:hypothetical protein
LRALTPIIGSALHTLVGCGSEADLFVSHFHQNAQNLVRSDEMLAANFYPKKMAPGNDLHTSVIELRRGYVYAKLFASPDPFGGFDDDVSRLVRHCRDHDVSEVLIECEIKDRLSNIKGYNMISELAHRLPHDLRVALAADDANNRKRFEFGLRVSPDIPMDLKIFGNVPEAEAWLLQVH